VLMPRSYSPTCHTRSGDTHTDDDSDLSLETLAQDMAALLKTLYGDNMPDLFIAGHRYTRVDTQAMDSEQLLGLIVTFVACRRCGP